MNIKKNYVFQLIYQIIILGVPLIISPYLTRTLGKTSCGIYAYTYSIAYYFLIFANLGIQKYGIRLIAQSKDNEEQLSKNFWSIYIVHLFFSLLSLGAYIIFTIFMDENYDVYLAQGIFVASAIFDITWLFYGLEKFKSVIFRNIIVKILEVICIFIFIKEPNDIYIYTLIMSLSIIAGNLLTFPYVFKIKFVKFEWKLMLKHIRPLLLLFLTVLATTIYNMLDKTLLGIFIDKDAVAIYEYSDKIVKVPLQLCVVLGTVIMPKVAILFKEKRNDEIRKSIINSTYFIMFISTAFAFGIASISDTLIPIYYTQEFIDCINVIKYLSIVIIIMSIGDVFRTQFIIPSGKDGLFLISIVVSALLNVIFNLIFIPLLSVYGAVIGTIIAELIGTLIQFFIVNSKLKILKDIIMSFGFIIIGVIMYFFVQLIGQNIHNPYLALTIQVVSGAFIYLSLSFIYLIIFKKELVMNFIKRSKKNE